MTHTHFSIHISLHVKSICKHAITFKNQHSKFWNGKMEKKNSKLMVSHEKHEPNDERFLDACRDGNVEIVKLLIANGFQVTDWDGGLRHACRGGHIEIVELLTSSGGVTDWDGGFRSACYGGHIKIVKMMIENGANCWNHWNIGLISFLGDIDTELLNLMFKCSENQLNEGFMNACYGGHVKIARLMIDHGANNWGGGVWCACRSDNIEIVNLLILHGGFDDWDGGLLDACENGRMEIAKLMIEHGAKPELCPLLTDKHIVAILNIGCPVECFFDDSRINLILSAHTEVKINMQKHLSQGTDSKQVRHTFLPLDVVNYCILPYVNYTHTQAFPKM